MVSIFPNAVIVLMHLLLKPRHILIFVDIHKVTWKSRIPSLLKWFFKEDCSGKITLWCVYVWKRERECVFWCVGTWVWMYKTCVSVCGYECIWVYANMNLSVHDCVWVCEYVWMYESEYESLWVSLSISMCVLVWVSLSVCEPKCVNVNLSEWVWMSAYMHNTWKCINVWVWVRVCKCESVYVSVRVCMSICVSVYDKAAYYLLVGGLSQGSMDNRNKNLTDTMSTITF